MLGWPVALLGVGVPLAGGLALLTGGVRAAVAAALALALPTLLILGIPGSAPFVTAAVLAFAVAALRVRRGRLGYAELSLCTLAGLVSAGGAWAVVDPAFFGSVSAELEANVLRQGRVWLAWLESSGAGARERLLFQEVVASSARLSARTWPAAVFGLLWTGAGAGWALAARRATGPAALRVTAAERCSRFRLPDVWLWAFVGGVSAYLLTPEPPSPPWPTAVHEAGLNLAIVAAGLYAWQGLAVALYFLERKGVRPAARVLLLGFGVLLFPLPTLLVAMSVGLADAWLDLRSRARPTPPAARASP